MKVKLKILQSKSCDEDPWSSPIPSLVSKTNIFYSLIRFWSANVVSGSWMPSRSRRNGLVGIQVSIDEHSKKLNRFTNSERSIFKYKTTKLFLEWTGHKIDCRGEKPQKPSRRQNRSYRTRKNGISDCKNFQGKQINEGILNISYFWYLEKICH